MNNIVRHAQANEVLIEITNQSPFILINIADNGVGFDTQSIDSSSGLGWRNIYARIKLFDGSIKIQSNKNNGSQFFIQIPII